MVGRWIKRGVLGSTGLVVALLAGELLLRLFADRPTYIQNMVGDAELGWRMVPGLRLPVLDERGEFEFAMNEQGFRGPAPPAEPAPEDTARLLFVGDSFLNAFVVRESELIPEVASRALANRGLANECYTISNSGYGTAQELLLLRRYGERVRPDAVVLCFYSGNDLANNTIELAGLVRGSELNTLRPYLVPDESGGLERVYTHGLSTFLRRSSYLYAHWELHRIRHNIARTGHHQIWPKTVRPQERVQQGLVHSEYLGFLVEPEPESPWSRAWTTTESLLIAFRDEVRRLDAELLVLVIPQRFQVSFDARPRMMDCMSRRWGGAPLLETLDCSLPETWFAQLCEREGIEVHFLLEEFREALRVEPDEPVYALDNHLLGRGHGIAGRAVADWYTQLGERSGEGLRSAAPAPPPSGLPVDHYALLGEAARQLEFFERKETHYLARGFVRWGPSWGELEGGWAVEASCDLMLAPIEEAITMRASLPEGCVFPATVTLIHKFGAGQAELVVEQPGEFELVLPPAKVSSYAGGVPLRISSTAVFPAWFEPQGAALLIHELSFRPDGDR